MEWKEVTLGEITNLVIDYRGKTPLKLGSSWSDSGYRALSAKNIKTGQIVAEDSIRFVDEELYRKWMKDEVNRGDILITSEAPFGQIYYWDSDEKIVLSQRLFDVRLNDEVCHKYVYYFMTSHRYQKDLEGRATGTTVTGLRQPELLKSTILLPPLSAQRSIASILSSLDRKIELNNKINADLEEMAQAIFKNWFVDFEPFKDGKFVDSELGMIPEGWKVGKITDIGCLITDYVSNGSFASLKQNVHLYETKEYAQFIRNTDLKTNTFSVYVDKHSYDFLSKSTLYGNEIIISNVGDVGSVHLCPKLDIPMTLGNNIIMLRPNEKEYNYFLYLWFKYFSGQGLIQGIKGGSAQPKFNKTDFKNLPLLIPSFEIIERSYWIFESMFSILSSNVKENSRLSLLRDTLLPRLMSGELEVPE